MEGRTRLAIGGIAAVASSVALVCAVAMTTSFALADSAGAPAGAQVIVPSAPTAVPVSPPESTEVAAPEQAAVDQPETVPAPEPEDVAPPADSAAPIGEPSAAAEDQLVAEIEQSGSWDAAYAWAEKYGWPRARVDEWIARLEVKLADKRAKDAASSLTSDTSGAGNRAELLLPAEAGNPSGLDLSGSSSGSKREQARVPPG